MLNYEKTHPPYSVMHSKQSISALWDVYDATGLALVPVALLSGARNHRKDALAQRLYDRMKSLFPNKDDHLRAALKLASGTEPPPKAECTITEVRVRQPEQPVVNRVVATSWTSFNQDIVVRLPTEA